MTHRPALRLVAFVALLVSIDVSLGALLARLNARTFTGERGGLTTLALGKDADVLVLGSSRAQFQVMPEVLTNQLGQSVYNAGLKGHDLLYAAMLADLWRARHPAPRAYLLTIDLESLLARPNEDAAASIMAPYVDESAVVQRVLYDDPLKRLMLISRSYRFNGRVFPIVKNLLLGSPPAQYDGFLPAEGVFDPGGAPARHGMNDVPDGVSPSREAAIEVSQQPYSALRVELLRGLAESAQRDGAQLLLVHAPIWGLPAEAHAHFAHRITELVASLPAVRFVDTCEFTEPAQFRGRADLFHDFNHLNPVGARVFSELLASRARDLLRAPLHGQRSP